MNVYEEFEDLFYNKDSNTTEEELVKKLEVMKSKTISTRELGTIVNDTICVQLVVRIEEVYYKIEYDKFHNGDIYIFEVKRLPEDFVGIFYNKNKETIK